MTIDQLRYFYEIADSGSFTKAAERLFLSQPTLSTAITKFETELGETLFSRHKTGITLTAYGKELLPYAKNILDLFNQMPLNFRSDKAKGVRFSVSAGSRRTFTEALGILYSAHKSDGIRIDFHNEGEEESLETVSNGAAEIGAYSFWDFQQATTKKRLSSMDLEFVQMSTSPVTVTVGPNNPLFHTEGDSVTLEEVRKYPFFVSYNEGGRLLSKRLALENKESLFFFYGSAIGFERLLEYMDCILLGSVRTLPHHGESASYLRTLVISDAPYYRLNGYIKRKSIPLSPLGEEFSKLLIDLSKIR